MAEIIPPDFGFNEAGHLTLRGVDLADIAKTYGTPCFVFDETRLRQNFRYIRDCFRTQYSNTLVYYSIKTNTNLALCRILKEERSYAAVASGLDLYVARKAGFPPEHIIFDGIYKSGPELLHAIREGVSQINVESHRELYCINELAGVEGKKQTVGLRIRLVRRKRLLQQFSSREGLFDFPSDRFGLSVDNALEACREAEKMTNISIEGLSVHIGGVVSNFMAYCKAVEILVRLAKRLEDEFGMKINSLNIGGGFGIPTIVEMTELDLTLDALKRKIHIPSSLDEARPGSGLAEIAREIGNALARESRHNNLTLPTLAIEPGRFIVGSAGILLLQVVDIRRIDTRTFVIVDGGTNLLSSIFERRLIKIANRLPLTKTVETMNICGPLPYALDLVGMRQKLPEIRVGDVIVVFDVGAYNLAQSKQFLYPKPPVLLVTEQGHVLVAREQETNEDVICHDRLCNSP